MASSVRKAVIPVAGFGTRFLPITKSIPKEMLPIVDKPIICYIVEEVVASGVTDILFVTSKYKKEIEDYFDSHYELEHLLEAKGKIEQLSLIKEASTLCNMYFIRQPEALGNGHAVNLAKAFVGNEPFAVLFGDDLMKSDTPVLKQLIDVHDKTGGNVIAAQEVPMDKISSYGVLKFADDNSNRIEGLVEKPKMEEAPSSYAITGRYVLNPEIFDALDKIDLSPAGEYYLTDAMLKLMETQEFYGCKYEGKYYDTGSKLGYLKATVDFALDRNIEGFKEFIDEKKVN